MTRWQLLLFAPVVVLAVMLALLCYLVLIAVSPPHAQRVLVAADQMVNAGFKGSEDETISSRAGKGAQRGVVGWCVLCRALSLLDPGHCQKSIEVDEGR